MNSIWLMLGALAAGLVAWRWVRRVERNFGLAFDAHEKLLKLVQLHDKRLEEHKAAREYASSSQNSLTVFGPTQFQPHDDEEHTCAWCHGPLRRTGPATFVHTTMTDCYHHPTQVGDAGNDNPSS